MNNTNGNLAKNVGKLLTDTNAQFFARLQSFTEAVVYIENLANKKTEKVNRAEFFDLLNTGRLHFIN